MDQENKGFSLKWPWNWLACGVFVAAAWRFIGIFSLLLAALFLWRQRKRRPDAAPQDGYCMDRTRKRLARLVWSVFYLLLAAGCGVVFFMGFGEEKTEIIEWAVWAVSGGGCLLFTLCCLYETYTDLRDAFFPAKSRLARSIRSQLRDPGDTPPVEELFAMVDRDIKENGQWFDRVAVGREWVLGDEASAISRIRGVFSRDEVRTCVSNGRRQSSRVLELWIADDRRQTQCTSLRSPSELQMAAACLRLRVPEACFDQYSRMSAFLGRTEEEWQAMEREFHRRRDQRLAEQAEQERLRDRRVPQAGLGNL